MFSVKAGLALLPFNVLDCGSRGLTIVLSQAGVMKLCPLVNDRRHTFLCLFLW